MHCEFPYTAAQDTWGMDVSHNLLCASTGHTSLLSAQHNNIQKGAAGNLDFHFLLVAAPYLFWELRQKENQRIMMKKNKDKLTYRQ